MVDFYFYVFSSRFYSFSQFPSSAQFNIPLEISNLVLYSTTYLLMQCNFVPVFDVIATQFCLISLCVCQLFYVEKLTNLFQPLKVIENM